MLRAVGLLLPALVLAGLLVLGGLLHSEVSLVSHVIYRSRCVCGEGGNRWNLTCGKNHCTSDFMALINELSASAVSHSAGWGGNGHLTDTPVDESRS